MNNIETKIFLQTKLRNLKRKNAKLANHVEFTDEYLSIEKEIKSIEKQLECL